MSTILSNQTDLAKAAAALAEINRAGLLDDLKDEIGAVRYRQRIDRQQQPCGMTPWLLLLAGDLARMTDLPRSQCEAAMRAAIGVDWPAVAITEIVRFADELKSARRQSA